MTKRKNIKAFTSLWPKIFKIKKTTKTKDVQWWLRAALVTSRQQLQGGFVLPTTVMVILVVVLVVTTLVFRSFNRTTQIIGERQQQVIYNAATPAIDRAKSKLENLFTKDTRLPAGVPSDSTLESLLGPPRATTQDPNPRDVYTIEGNRDNGAEGRLNFGNTVSNRDAAGWYFQERDAQGNIQRIVAYSINFKKQAVDVGNPENPADDRVLARLQDNTGIKAANSVVRNGPVNAINANENPCGGGAIRLTANERDWEPISSATLAKTFQVTAVAIDNPGRPNQTLTTLEFQQDRQADKGNKWGVYFRYDLELFNAPQFNWNGAMRSDGNIFLGPFGDRFRAFLISAPNSCVNTSANDSRISVGEYRDGTGRLTFQGQIAAGRLNLQEFNGGSRIDLFTSLGAKPEEQRPLDAGRDSVNAAVTAPDSLALDPIALFTEDTFRARGPNPTNVANRDPAWDRSRLKKRIENESVNPPYLDDTFRADNRYGPNPTYDGKPLAQSRSRIPVGQRVGDPITTTDPNFQSLTRNFSIDPRNPDDLGLDGYWERRAVRGGLRVIVGQRLELAGRLPSPAGPVNPVVNRREHEFLQRRTQHNNLSAVQATAVYHYQNGIGPEAGLPPVACVATTVHPGTAQTLRNSATFDMMNINGTPTLMTDFLNGRGTNGVEFEPIGAGGPNGQMLVALNNLARSSGDPNGAFPPVQPPVGSQARPSVNLTPYGDFSNLQRALRLGAYNTLSIADRSYIDTASCSLGMLAYQLNNLQTYNYNNLGALNAALAALSNGNANDGEVTIAGNNVTIQPAPITGQPLPAARTVRLPAPPTGAPGTPPPPVVAPPEAYIEALPQAQQQLARFVATKEQVERDRRGPGGTGYSCNNAKFNTAGATNLQNLCATTSKYVALYYTFPLVAHTTGGVTYNAVIPGDVDLMPRLPGTGLIPRTNVTGLVGTVPGGGASLPNSNVTNLNNLIRFNSAPGTTQYFQVAFKDGGMFNGREMMSKRVLDIDVNLLRTTPAPGGDFWLPINDNTARDPNAPPPTGVVYAFREDAVREDGIARPASASGMDARPSSIGDPTITSPIGISVKPVDYLPDPDRRPNGFRLKNGTRLDRGNNSAGMSFISDNAIYIFGDFNLHSTDGTRTNLIEEFTEALRADWTNFYTRNRRDDRFARPATDTWRPTEVLGDSVTVLSGNFCDGSIEDGIIYPDQNPAPALGFNIQTMYGCNNAAQFTSYLNQNRPTAQLTNLPAAFAGINNNAWVRENPFDPTSPISISPTGKPFYMTAAGPQPYELRTPGGTGEAETYLRFEDDDPRCGVLGGQRKCIGRADRTIVNSIIIQSIIPSRAGQSYGGFHNFPRLIENWDNVDLNMAGSFIQLRFSTQATGHYDQDAWEPRQVPLTSGGRHEQLFYYDPPNRRWGYDVALQYQTAGPVARRFSVPGNARSEVYREIPIDDPYVRRILCATKTDGRRVDTTTTCN